MYPNMEIIIGHVTRTLIHQNPNPINLSVQKSSFDFHSVWSLLKYPQNNWTASSEFGTYRLCEQRRFRRACASAQSRQNLRCSLIQAVSQEEPSDRKPDPWPLWMAGHAQLKFVMTECWKTQIRLTELSWFLILLGCHQMEAKSLDLNSQ